MALHQISPTSDDDDMDEDEAEAILARIASIDGNHALFVTRLLNGSDAFAASFHVRRLRQLLRDA